MDEENQINDKLKIMTFSLLSYGLKHTRFFLIIVDIYFAAFSSHGLSSFILRIFIFFVTEVIFSSFNSAIIEIQYQDCV